MKYTKEEKLNIGRRIYTGEITYKDAMSQYGLSKSATHQCLADYKRANNIPLSNRSRSQAFKPDAADMERYMAMSKEELINELIISKANELRAKKGYEVKGDGANKEFVILSGRNSRS